MLPHQHAVSPTPRHIHVQKEKIEQNACDGGQARRGLTRLRASDDSSDARARPFGAIPTVVARGISLVIALA